MSIFDPKEELAPGGRALSSHAMERNLQCVIHLLGLSVGLGMKPDDRLGVASMSLHKAPKNQEVKSRPQSKTKSVGRP